MAFGTTATCVPGSSRLATRPAAICDTALRAAPRRAQARARPSRRRTMALPGPNTQCQVTAVGSPIRVVRSARSVANGLTTPMWT